MVSESKKGWPRSYPFFYLKKTRFWLEPQITAVIINWQSIVVAIVDCIESFIETKRKREQSENCSFFCLKKGFWP